MEHVTYSVSSIYPLHLICPCSLSFPLRQLIRADEARRAATDILSKATGIVSKLEDAGEKQMEAERAINATDDKMTQVHSHMAQVGEWRGGGVASASSH